VKELIEAVLKAGAPVLGTVLGGPVGTLAGAVVGALAEALGTPATPEAVKTAIETRPDAVAVVQKVETQRGPEFMALQTATLALYADMTRNEMEKGWFFSAWRPAGMWLVLIMWPFAIMLAPTFKIMVPMGDLTAFTGLYLTLYMGGHTAKEWFAAHYQGKR
jgi:hypothetical protein